MLKKAKNIMIISSLISFSLALSAGASPHKKNLGLELGAGLNTLTPYGNLRFHYAPEATGAFTFNSSLQIGERFSKTTGPGDLNFMGTVGSRYYFLKDGWFQPFVSGDIGLTSTVSNNPGVLGFMGVGSDFMFNDAFGMSLAISSDLRILNPGSVMSGTTLIRPEVNAIWRF